LIVFFGWRVVCDGDRGPYWTRDFRIGLSTRGIRARFEVDHAGLEIIVREMDFSCGIVINQARFQIIVLPCRIFFTSPHYDAPSASDPFSVNRHRLCSQNSVS
jgi:hypothetical protein